MGCTSIPHLQSRLVEHAAKEDVARKNLDKEFKAQCSNGKELYNVPRDKVSNAIDCGSKVFDDTFLEHARYEDLAVELKQYLISQSAAYSQKKISKKTYKSRIIKAWNTYNVEWLERSKSEVNETISNNEKISKVAEGAVVVVAVVALVALAAAGAGGGSGGNSFANSYDGNCPCPGDIDAAGNRCGARSAYSRTGGASPYCPANRM